MPGMGRILIALITTVMASQVLAEPIRFESRDTRVTLLELYTSEGCSSCPRADRWLSRLKNDPRLWKEVIPVAFHVDYWDYIGWPDRFASPVYSQRQRAHASQWLRGSVYTPGLVLDGDEWRGWFRSPELKLQKNPPAGNLRLELEGANTHIVFTNAKDLPDNIELHLAVLGFDLTTAVKAGENRGKTLTHDFVVLGYERIALVRHDGSYGVQTPLPPVKVKAPRMALAAWVSLPNNPRPIQAVGGWM